jgi:hypothetical protein
MQDYRLKIRKRANSCWDLTINDIRGKVNALKSVQIGYRDREGPYQTLGRHAYDRHMA